MRAYQQLVTTTKEQLQTEISSTTDPTGTAPKWAVVPSDEDEPATGSASWVTGSWDPVGWSSRTGVAVPVSGYVGSGHDHDLVRGQAYKVFVRWADGSALPVKFVGIVVAT